MQAIETWTTEQRGITYQVQLFADDDANADPGGQGDVYEAPDLEAHARGDWLFVGVVVTPIIGGREISGASDSLWAVEYGDNPGRWVNSDGRDLTIGQEYITDVHPVPDMISEVRANLEKLQIDLNRVDLSD